MDNKKIIFSIAFLLTVLSHVHGVTDAFYRHHQRTTTTALEADLVAREIGIDASARNSLIAKKADGNLIHVIAKEMDTASLSGVLNVAGTANISGAVKLANYTSGQVPYFTTGGLITSGTGLTYNGSAFGVTGTGAISGNTTVGGTLGVTGAITASNLTASSAVATDASKNFISVTNTGTGNNVLSASPTLTGTISAANQTLSGTLAVTGASTLTGAVTVSNTTEATTPSSASVMLSGGLGISKALYSSSYFVSSLTGKNTFILNSTGSDFGYISNPASNTWALGYGTVFTTLGTSALTWNTSGAISIPGTLSVTGASTLTGAVTHGAGFIDKTTSLTSNTTLTTAHSVILANATSGTFTITLPTAVGNSGLTYKIMKNDASTNCVAITTTSSQAIGPYSGYGLCGNYGTSSLSVISNNANWLILEAKDFGYFTYTMTGMTTSPTGTAYWELNALGSVNLTFDLATGTSNSTSFTVTGIPAVIQPASLVSVECPILLTDNGTSISGKASLSPGSGTITFYASSASGTFVTFSSTGFTNSGTKKIGDGRKTSISYCRL